MGDLLAQDVVGAQPDGVEVACLLKPLIECRDRIGGVSAKEAAPKVAASVAGDDRVENISPAIGTVDVAIAQSAALSVSDT
jgi:hypothetical protein